MTTKIKNWSTTEASNNSASPNGAPEGMAPSTVNNVIRMVMGAVRAWFEDAQWIDFGYAGLTYFDANNFTVTGDKTAILTVGRRVRAIGTTPFTIYGTITVSAYNAPNTKITVAWDAATLDNTLSEVAFGASTTGNPISSSVMKFLAATIPYATISDPPSIPVGIPTGAIFAYAGAAAPASYLLVSNKTIGDGTSNATARANADTSDLFTLLWNTFANTELPIVDSAGVASVRGISAAADFAAHKALPLLDLRGRVIAGLDNMGGVAAGRLTAASFLGTTVGKTGGEETHALVTAELAEHAHKYTDLSHSVALWLKAGGAETVNTVADVINSSPNAAVSPNGGTYATTTVNAGSGTAHNNVQPTIVLPYIIKL